MGIIQKNMQPVDMDQLSYTYEANSNQLIKVTDQVLDDYQLGDFINGNSGQSIDYEYDANGNLTKDLNKGISNISYTYFNKPQTISFADGNSISYSYDAAGGKVQELIINNSVTKRTDYAGNFIYQNDSLQYALTPVGRTVWENGTAKEEFFVKDHLGNVRSVVEVGQMNFVDYLGSYELASANLENLVFDFHGDIRDDKPGSLDPLDLKAGRLNGAEEDRRIGTALLLKVMAGDRVELNADNYYENYMPGSDDDLVNAEDLLENILTVLSGGAGGFEGGEVHNPGFVNELFHPANFMTAEGILRADEDPQRPKAYLNYILFDEQMEIVSTFTGSFQANGNGAWQEIGTTAPMEIPANGYLAVYLSNQSRPSGCHVCGNVFFDRVKVRFSQGKLKEETHYYPFGLPMGNAGSTASNFLPNRRKYQSNEYIKDLSLNWMDFNFRSYDPQLGRFLSVDPLAASGGQDRLSPYAAMGNQPEFAVDPEGLVPQNFQAAGLGSPPEEGGPASSGWNMLGKGSDMWYESYMNFGGSGGGGGGASAASEYAISNNNFLKLSEMVEMAVNNGGYYYFIVNLEVTVTERSRKGWEMFEKELQEKVNETLQRNYIQNHINEKNADRSAWDRAAYWGLMPYKPKTPDAIAISIPFMVTGISGLGISYNIGFVGKDLVHYYSFSTQLGTPDVSLGLGVSWSYYTGIGKPSAANFFGYSKGGGGTIGIFSGSYSQGLDSYGGKVIWNNYQINIVSPSLGGYYAPYIYTNGWIIHTFK